MAQINFKNIPTAGEISKIDEKKHETIANIGKGYFKRYNDSVDYQTFLPVKANEYIHVSLKYRQYNLTERKVLAANMLYSDDKLLIEYLISKGITYNKLFSYSMLISKIKRLAENIDELELFGEVQLAAKSINNLCSIFKSYNGFTDYNLMLVKINEIVVFDKDLYKDLEEKHNTKKK